MKIKMNTFGPKYIQISNLKKVFNLCKNLWWGTYHHPRNYTAILSFTLSANDNLTAPASNVNYDISIPVKLG